MAINIVSASNQFITIGASTGGQNVTGVTLMAWVNPATLAGGTERFIARFTTGISGTNSRIHISQLAVNQWRAGGRRLDLDLFSSADGGTVTVGALTHVCARMTYNGQSCELFVNGVSVTDTNVAGWTGSSSNTDPTFVGIATGTAAGSNFPDASISDVRLYNRAISDNEILTIYNAQGKDNICESLIHRWQLNEGVTGATAVDSSGNANGTPSNNPTYTTGQVPLQRRIG